MNTLRIAFALLLCVIVLGCVAPIIVKSTTTGDANGVLQDIFTSIDQTNEALEDGPVGDFFAELDAKTN